MNAATTMKPLIRFSHKLNTWQRMGYFRWVNVTPKEARKYADQGYVVSVNNTER